MLAVALATAGLWGGLTAAPADAAVSYAVKMRAMPDTVYATQTLLLRGSVAKPLRGTRVKLQYYKAKRWRDLATVRASKASGTWRARVKVPANLVVFRVRAVTTRGTVAVTSRAVSPAPDIKAAGPGGYLMGIDVSMWQHQVCNRSFDYVTMKANGVAFLIAKGSDANTAVSGTDYPCDKDSSPDQRAAKYAAIDAAGAKAAGIYVGYYHWMEMPTKSDGSVTNSTDMIVASALQQAQQVATRLRDLGGYDDMTLPYALDMEAISPGYSAASISLWVRTWVAKVTELTGRTPMIYSMRSYLDIEQDQTGSVSANGWTVTIPDGAPYYGRYNGTGRTDWYTNIDTRRTLQSMPLWIADPDHEPALQSSGNPQDLVGACRTSMPACWVNAWTLADCNLQWTFWQYGMIDAERVAIPYASSNCPIDSPYCVAPSSTAATGSRVDVNAFNGSPADLAALAAGTWSPPLELQ